MKARLTKESTVNLTLIIGVVFLAVCLVGGLGFLFVQDVTRWGKFPPGSAISGVNVSGLGKADAVKKVEDELQGVAQKPVMLTLDGLKYTATPEQLGLRLDYQQMVDSAYKQAWAPNIFARMFASFDNRPKTVNGLLVIQNNDTLVTQFVQSVTKDVNHPPRNAYVDVTSGNPVIVPSRDGYQVPEATIRYEVGSAMNTKGRTTEIVAKKTPATLKDSNFHKLIIVNLSGHMLYLWDRDKPLAQFAIACGQPAYPTPVGQWQIVGKQMNPTWYNPHDAWSGSMPETIPPGYSNPLGLRAMPLNASGVLIHGTANDGSIGTSASHGCMRMHMNDVIQLFDMVEVGTPVYIIRAPGDPGFDVTKTPSWRKVPAGPSSSTYTGD